MTENATCNMVGEERSAVGLNRVAHLSARVRVPTERQQLANEQEKPRKEEGRRPDDVAAAKPTQHRFHAVAQRDHAGREREAEPLVGHDW